MKKLQNALVLLIAVGLSVWLFFNENAAKPGNLSRFHEGVAVCEDCHAPWRGVSEKMCLQCHYFGNVGMLDPTIRFHEAHKLCLQCHSEHRGLNADIAKMDHTILNGELLCTQCHLDPHDGLFGRDCRECHGISSWDVEGFRHPEPENRNCHRCHKAPHSHFYGELWELIEKGHFDEEAQGKSIPRKECWRCHTTHRWDHLKMEHGLESAVRGGSSNENSKKKTEEAQ